MKAAKSDETEKLAAHQADLWAMFYGFNDVNELKKWGEQIERKRLAEMISKKGAE